MNINSNFEYSIYYISMFLIIASITGPKTLIGINTREVVPEENGGLATGIVGSIGQIGSTFSGSGIAFIVQNYGWKYYHLILYFISILTIICYLISFIFCKLDRNSTFQLKKVL